MTQMYKGFDLFLDIEDQVLRTRNQSVVLCNIAEDNTKNKLITPRGAALILGYFSAIPDADKELVNEQAKAGMKLRGYAA